MQAHNVYFNLIYISRVLLYNLLGYVHKQTQDEGNCRETRLFLRAQFRFWCTQISLKVRLKGFQELQILILDRIFFKLINRIPSPRYGDSRSLCLILDFTQPICVLKYSNRLPLHVSLSTLFSSHISLCAVPNSLNFLRIIINFVEAYAAHIRHGQILKLCNTYCLAYDNFQKRSECLQFLRNLDLKISTKKITKQQLTKKKPLATACTE